MISHNRIAQHIDIDPIISGQKLQPLLDPITSMFKGLSGMSVDAAQHGTPDCSLDAVDNRNLLWIKHIPPILPGHERYRPDLPGTRVVLIPQRQTVLPQEVLVIQEKFIETCAGHADQGQLDLAGRPRCAARHAIL
jgi:hypothetical protein